MYPSCSGDDDDDDDDSGGDCGGGGGDDSSGGDDAGGDDSGGNNGGNGGGNPQPQPPNPAPNPGLFGGFCDASNTCTPDVGPNGVPWNWGPGYAGQQMFGLGPLLQEESRYLPIITSGYDPATGDDPCVFTGKDSNGNFNGTVNVVPGLSQQGCWEAGGQWVAPGSTFTISLQGAIVPIQATAPLPAGCAASKNASRFFYAGGVLFGGLGLVGGAPLNPLADASALVGAGSGIVGVLFDGYQYFVCGN